VYEHGLPPDNDDNRLARKKAQRRLDTLLDTVKQSQALALFVPGNHDWKANDRGYEEAHYINAQIKGGYPVPIGCPGPMTRDFNRVRIVAVDTEAWLRGHRSGCSTSIDDVKKNMKDLLASAAEIGLHVIVVGHHPLASHGTHGGFYNWQDHLFPLTRIERYRRVQWY
jgi:hypothetical protein